PRDWSSDVCSSDLPAVVPRSACCTGRGVEPRAQFQPSSSGQPVCSFSSQFLSHSPATLSTDALASGAIKSVGHSYMECGGKRSATPLRLVFVPYPSQDQPLKPK